MEPTAFLVLTEMTCGTCGRPIEVSVIQDESGAYQEFFQCWHCLTSYPHRSMRTPLYTHSNETVAIEHVYHT